MTPSAPPRPCPCVHPRGVTLRPPQPPKILSLFLSEVFDPPQGQPCPHSPPRCVTPPSLSSCPFIFGRPDNTPKGPGGCHGTQGCSKPKPRTLTAPSQNPAPPSAPQGCPAPRGWQCLGVTGGGVAVPGGRRCPHPGCPLRSLSHSCAMAIGEVRPCERPQPPQTQSPSLPGGWVSSP